MRRMLGCLLLLVCWLGMESGCYIPLDNPGFRCDAAQDCPSDHPFCLDGVCHSCTSNFDCPVNQVCQKWRCKACPSNNCEWNFQWNLRSSFAPESEESRQATLRERHGGLHTFSSPAQGWVGWLAFRDRVQSGNTRITTSSSPNILPLFPSGSALWLGWFSSPREVIQSAQLTGRIEAGSVRSAVDGEGNLYLAGRYQDDLVWKGQESPILSINEDENTRYPTVFVVKFLATGKFAWAKRLNGVTALLDTDASPCGLDVVGNTLYLVGHATAGTMRVDEQTLSHTSPFLYLTALRTQDGQPRWLRSHTGTTRIRCGGITAGPKGLAVTGSFQGTLQAGNQQQSQSDPNTLFVSWTNPQGQTTSLQAASPGSPSSRSEGTAITVGEDGTAYLAGHFQGVMAMGTNTLSSTSPTRQALWVSAWQPNQGFLWSLASQGEGEHTVSSIALSPSNKLILAGFFRQSLTLGSFSFKTSSVSQLFVASLLPSSLSFQKVLTTQQSASARSVAHSLQVDSQGRLVLVGSSQGRVGLEDTLLYSWLLNPNDRQEPLPLLFWWSPPTSSFP